MRNRFRKPPLKQISDFGLALVDKEKYIVIKDVEYIQLRKSKRYSKQVVIYVAHIFYNYSRLEIAAHFKITASTISTHLSAVAKSNTKQETADESYQSLNYMYKSKYINT